MEGNFEKKKKVLEAMFDIYIKKNPKEKDVADDLKKYSLARLEKCPNIEKDIYCKSCKIRCYSKENQEKIKKVMRFSGPRMIIYHPFMAFDHLISNIKNKK
jgi:hypothetical protein